MPSVTGSFLSRGNLLNQTIPKDLVAEAEVECQDCHLSSQNKVLRPDENKCLDCHEEEYGKRLKEWQQEIKNGLNSLRVSLKDKKRIPLSAQEKSLAFTIENMFNKIELDGSFGVHNYLFVEEIVNNYKKKLETVGGEKQ